MKAGGNGIMQSLFRFSVHPIYNWIQGVYMFLRLKDKIIIVLKHLVC